MEPDELRTLTNNRAERISRIFDRAGAQFALLLIFILSLLYFLAAHYNRKLNGDSITLSFIQDVTANTVPVFILFVLSYWMLSGINELKTQQAIDSLIRQFATALHGTAQSPGLVSAEIEISHYRSIWHHYHVTKMRGKVVWRYRIYDFSKNHMPGRLTTKIVADGLDGEHHEYLVEAGRLGARFILLERAVAGHSETIVEVYPHMGFNLRSVHAGVSILMTWDGDESITHCIMSKTPLVREISEGTIDDKHFSLLDDKWNEGMSQIKLCFPRKTNNSWPAPISPTDRIHQQETTAL